MPDDHTVLVTSFRRQADACRELGSAFYALLLDRVGDDIEAGGPAAAVLAGHESDPPGSALSLRLLGGVHRLVLERRVPELATSYPSVGGTGDAAAAWPAFRNVLVGHADELRQSLSQPPQTNEVGRAAVLAGGLAHLAAWRPAPVRLVEIGASAGLNLRVDRFRVESGDGGQGGVAVGPPDSPLVLRDAWRGRLPPAGRAVQVVARLGCDAMPIDPATTEGRLTLTSYVWPDQTERLERLRAAFEVARRTPADVVAESAEPFVRRLALVPGTTTVVWHSIMWQYLGAGERAAVDDALEQLGATSDATTGLARVSMEPGRREPGAAEEVLVRLRTWPGDGVQAAADGGHPWGRILGTAAPHGLPVTWE